MNNAQQMGNSLAGTPNHVEFSTFKGQRYRYYTAPKTTSVQTDGSGLVTLPTHELHQVVIDHLREGLKDPQPWLDDLPEE